jgi:parvulin-like peptidyl-prolyl isomerase
MKKILLLTLSLQIFLSSAVWGETPADQESAKPALKVNGEIVTVGELDSVVKRQPAFAFYSKMGKADPSLINDFRWNETQGVIDRKLLEQEIKKSGIIGDAELSQIVEKRIESDFGGQSRLNELMAKLGSNPASFTNEFKNQVRVQTYAERAIAPQVTVSPEEIKKAIESNPQQFEVKLAVRARHILVKSEPAGSDGKELSEARSKIDTIYAKAKLPGSDFGALAKEYSACPSASKGGDLGFFETGAMVPEFEKAAFALKPGEMSEPIKTQFGYHIIKVEERREPSPTANEDKARATIRQNKINLKMTEKIAELKKTASIEILLPPRKQAAANK